MKRAIQIKALVLAMASAGIVTLPNYAIAIPSGGQVVAGSATIQQESATKLGITQSTEKAIIDWQKYSIGLNEHVQYYQPSARSVVLNRVVGQDPSQILGRLTANGQVFLVNPNGIYFGKNAQIDVAGLVASTHNIRNEDFMAGRYKFDIPGKPNAAVINEGTIRIADTGVAAFIAPSIANRGVISAKLGKVALASANGFTLDFYGDELLSFLVSDEVAQTAFDIEGRKLTSFVENAGKIEAQGGYVLLTAKAAENAVHSVINQSGIIEATSVAQKNGEILLSGGDRGSVVVSGTLDASGKGPGQTGGRVIVTGDNVELLEGSKIDVSGDQGGGKAIIGGDYLGGRASAEQQAETGIYLEPQPIPTSRDVRVEAGAVINANALTSGDGGKVILWADNRLDFDGQITARGGADGGNGGRVETSGKQQMYVIHGKVDAGADNGTSGLWFMDPLDVVIGDSVGDDGVTHSRYAISDALNNGTTVTIQSANGPRPGSITLLGSIIKTAEGTSTLNLFSDGAIILNRGGRILSFGGKLNVNINARYNNEYPSFGLVAIGNDSDYAIRSNGGDVDVEGLIQTYQGLAVKTNGGAFRARTTPRPPTDSTPPQSDERGFIGIGPTPINRSDKYTIDTGTGNITMRATGGTITLDNHALATLGNVTLTAAQVLAQPNILSFNMADEANRPNLEGGLGGSEGYGSIFPHNDDNYTSVNISLLSGNSGLTVLGRNFGNEVYLSNNGYIRLDHGDGTFTPYPLTTTNNPIIAAYFGDVDTRGNIGNVYYGTLATETNNKAVLTWIDAGYYSFGADKRNTFQLQLENLGLEINMRMSYDQLQWTTGSASGGTSGLGGTVARAGFSIPGTVQTVRFELPASGNQDAMLALDDLPGNTGYRGRWSFRLWSTELPPNKNDGRYEVAAKNLYISNDARETISNHGIEKGAYPISHITGESIDYRRALEYWSRLDRLFALKHGVSVPEITIFDSEHAITPNVQEESTISIDSRTMYREEAQNENTIVSLSTDPVLFGESEFNFLVGMSLDGLIRQVNKDLAAIKSLPKSSRDETYQKYFSAIAKELYKEINNIYARIADLEAQYNTVQTDFTRSLIRRLIDEEKKSVEGLIKRLRDNAVAKVLIDGAAKASAILDIYDWQNALISAISDIYNNKKLSFESGMKLVESIASFNPIAGTLIFVKDETDKVLNITRGINEYYRETVSTILDQYYLQYRTLFDMVYKGANQYQIDNRLKLFETHRAGLVDNLKAMKKEVSGAWFLIGKKKTIANIESAIEIISNPGIRKKQEQFVEKATERVNEAKKIKEIYTRTQTVN